MRPPPKKASLPVHAVNSSALALLYAATAHDRLPAKPVLRGAVFATVENTLVFPLTLLEGRHPAVNNGQIDRYWSLRSYLWTIPRHVLYGAVVGAIYGRLRSRRDLTL